MPGMESLAWPVHSSKPSPRVGCMGQPRVENPAQHNCPPEQGLTQPFPPPCRYPHDVVNHLSCDEARNHYGGVASGPIPIILDLMKEWVAPLKSCPAKRCKASE